MLISELTFPHLQAAQDAQLQQQLERRRIAIERRAEGRPARGGRRAAVVTRGASSERMPRAAVEPGSTASAPAARPA